MTVRMILTVQARHNLLEVLITLCERECTGGNVLTFHMDTHIFSLVNDEQFYYFYTFIQDSSVLKMRTHTDYNCRLHF